MHQPYYKDDIENKTLMPWVFLHGIKDYYDMPWLLSRFSKVKATFNLVPSLILQLEFYAKNMANDVLLDAIENNYDPSPQQKILLDKYLFLANEKNMIKPLNRYDELHQKFLLNNSLENFTFNEVVDCKVLFLLSWCGNYLRSSNPLIQTLLNKGQNFSTMEKNMLLKELINFIPNIIIFYKDLAQKKQIALSTTPFYHPILPLLIDFNSAVDAKPDVKLPRITTSLTAYSALHTKSAIKYFQEIFGKKPKGFWPAEGSISPKTADLLCINGVQWMASDEDILFKTLNTRNRSLIYKNYKLQTRYGLIDVRFRDRTLSDAIGFEYSNHNAKFAVRDFVDRLKNIYNSHSFSPLVNIILDGENAWEFYENGAEDFFTILYQALEDEDFIECVTMDEVEDLPIEHDYIPYISSGSWINGNFDIWIGSSEKNRAWELISLTYQYYLAKKDKLNKEQTLKIQKEFMIAQSSDWFWWYGDDHYTVLADEFDKLFRKHLINIFRLMAEEIPSEVLKPIIWKKNNNFHTKATDYIEVDLEKDGNFFEWVNSAKVDLQKEFSVMDSKKMPITKFNYGYNPDYIYFLFKCDVENLVGSKFIFQFNDLTLSAIIPKIGSYINDDEGFIKIFSAQNIKIGVPRVLFEEIHRIKFSFKLIKDNNIIQFFPIYGDFLIDFEKLKIKHWFV